MPTVMGSISFRFSDQPVDVELVTADLVRYEMRWGPPPATLTIPEQAQMAHVVMLRLQRQGMRAEVPEDYDTFLDGIDFPPAAEPKASPVGKARPRTRPRSSSPK